MGFFSNKGILQNTIVQNNMVPFWCVFNAFFGCLIRTILQVEEELPSRRPHGKEHHKDLERHSGPQK